RTGLQRLHRNRESVQWIDSSAVREFTRHAISRVLIARRRGGRRACQYTLDGSMARASSSFEVHVVDYSESIPSIHRVQFGIDLVEETLDFVALVRARIFFQAAEQALLSPQHVN